MTTFFISVPPPAPDSRQQRHAGSFGRALVEGINGPAAGIACRHRDQRIGEITFCLLELPQGSSDAFSPVHNDAAGAQQRIHNLLHAGRIGGVA